MACGGCDPCPDCGADCTTLVGHGDRPPICLHPAGGRNKWHRWTKPTDGDRCPDHRVPFSRRSPDGDLLCPYVCIHWKKGDLVREPRGR